MTELPPWVIEDLKQHKHEQLHQDNQPRIELPLPEPPSDENEEPQERHEQHDFVVEKSGFLAWSPPTA